MICSGSAAAATAILTTKSQDMGRGRKEDTYYVCHEWVIRVGFRHEQLNRSQHR